MSRPPFSSSRWIVVAVAVAAIALAAFRAFTVDDAFITYRHAHNWAHGDGAVMNPGERVEGVSNLPWTLLLGVAATLGIAPHVAGPWGSALLALVAVVATARLAARGGVAAPVAAFAAATFLPLAIWGASGMETAAVSVALAAGAACVVARPVRAVCAGVCFAAVAVLRPEGLVFGVVAAAVYALGARRRHAAWWIAGIPIAVWLLFAAGRLLYYGDWLPNPARAKSPALSALVPGMIYVAKFVVSYPLAFAALVSPALESRVRNVALALVAAQVLFAVAAGGDHFAGYRFLLPVWPLLAVAVAAANATTWDRWARTEILVALAVAALACVLAPHWLLPVAARIADATRLQWPVAAHGERLLAEIRHLGAVAAATAAFLAFVRARRLAPAAKSAPHPGASPWVAAAAVAALFWPQLADPQIRACVRADGASRYGRVVGEFLHDHLPPGTVVATNAAGALPYFSQLPVIDMLGLTDRALARSPSNASGWIGHERGDGAAVLDREPPLIILGGAEGSPTPWPFPGDRSLVADPRFARDYVLGRARLQPPSAPAFDFVYFRRHDCEPCRELETGR